MKRYLIAATAALFLSAPVTGFAAPPHYGHDPIERMVGDVIREVAHEAAYPSALTIDERAELDSRLRRVGRRYAIRISLYEGADRVPDYRMRDLLEDSRSEMTVRVSFRNRGEWVTLQSARIDRFGRVLFSSEAIPRRRLVERFDYIVSRYAETREADRLRELERREGTWRR